MIKNSYVKTKQYYKADKKVEKSVPKIAVSVHNNQDGTDGTNVASEYFYRYTISTYKETYYTERGGIIGCLLHQSPKLCNKDFLIIGLTTLQTLVNFDWLIHQVKSSNIPTTNFKL